MAEDTAFSDPPAVAPVESVSDAAVLRRSVAVAPGPDAKMVTLPAGTRKQDIAPEMLAQLCGDHFEEV